MDDTRSIPTNATVPLAQPIDPVHATSEKIDEYRLDRVLGRGGMGVVYMGWDEGLDRPVALKVIAPQIANDPDSISRLRIEAQAVAKLNHPNIVSVYRFGTGNPSYIAMEYIEGTDLGHYITQRGTLEPIEALRIMADAAAGLGYAAARSIVHRDIKPANILICTDGSAKVMDFGLAKRLDVDSNMTASGSVVGTPNYMAPEQALGRKVDARADMYSLGCTLFTMLTGRRPFESTTPFGIMNMHINEPLPIPAEWRKIAGGELVALLERLTVKDPTGRFANWEEAGAAIAHVSSVLGGAARPRRRGARGLVPILTTAALIAAVVFSVAAYMMSGKSSTPRGPETPMTQAASGVSARETAAAAPAQQAPTPTSDPAAEDTAPPEQAAQRPLPSERIDQALDARERVLRLSLESRWDEAIAEIQAQRQSDLPPMAAQVLQQYGDLTILGLRAAAQWEASLFPSGTVPHTPREKVETTRAFLGANLERLTVEQGWSSVLYMIALSDPNAPAAVDGFESRFPGHTPEQGRILHGMQTFFTPMDNARRAMDRLGPAGPGGRRLPPRPRRQ